MGRGHRCTEYAYIEMAHRAYIYSWYMIREMRK